jgi:hypothetical protein
MRLLLAMLVLLALATLGWTGWWFYQADAREQAVRAWLAERRAAGWEAEAAELQVSGFPYRFDTEVTGLGLADPAAGWSWAAPRFQFVSLAYRPQHIIADWPGEQVFATPFETVRVASDVLRGSVVFDPLPRLPLDRATVEVRGMTLAGDRGWQATVTRALFALRRAPAPETIPEAIPEAIPDAVAYDVSLTAEGLRLPEAWTARLDRAGTLPEALEAAGIDATVLYDRPWDRTTVEGENPAVVAIRIREARFGWGRLDLRGSGTLRPDAEGFAEGEIALRARNWRDMLDAAEGAGALGGAFGGAISGALRGGLGLLAQLSGDPEVLELPLTFAGGRTRLGPIALGPAPVLAAPAQGQ